MRRLLFILGGLLVLFAALIPVLAQEEDERSALVRFVEERISAPNMQVRLNGIEGALSSDVRMESITLSGDDGVWLTISKPRMVWSRAALLRGRLEIESLTAARIDWPRGPLPDETLPSPEAKPFKLPELPVAVVLKQLSAPVVTLGEPVFGLAAQVSLNGRFTLDGGSLDTDIDVVRTDGAGGSLSLAAAYGGETRRLAIDAALEEPQGGVVANLLDLEGAPPVAFTVKGEGPIDDVVVQLRFDVASQNILAGALELSRAEAGIAAKLDAGGPIGTLMPAAQRRLFGDDSRLTASALFGSDNRIGVDSLVFRSGAISLEASARLLADGFLEALKLDAGLRAADGERLAITGGDGGLSIGNAAVRADYDAASAGGWRADIDARGIRSGTVSVETLALAANGTVSNAADPATRAATYDFTGAAQGVAADDPALAVALGERIDFDGSGYWSAGQPLTIRRLQAGGDNFIATLSGALAGLAFDGKLDLQADRLDAFAALSGSELAGSASLVAQGRIEPVSGAFDIALDGTTRDLAIGSNAADALLAGETKLQGGVARSEEGLSFRQLRIVNPQLNALLDGSFASSSSSLLAEATIRDIGVALEEASGALRIDASVRGAQQPYEATAKISMPEGRLAGRPVRELALQFAGQAQAEGMAGKIAGSGRIGNDALAVSGDLAAKEDGVDLRDFLATIGATRIEGSIARSDQGLIDGRMQIASSDIGALAALANVKAKGAVNGSVQLSASDGKQQADADLKAGAIAFGDIAVASADIKAKVADLFGAPRIDADAKASGVAAGGVSIRDMQAKASTQGNDTDFELTARMAREDARLAANGRATQGAGATVVDLRTLALQSRIADAKLERPARITIRDGVVSFGDGAELSVGGGRVSVLGSAGETLDMKVAVRSLPLAIANAVRPDLRAAGSLDAQASITGKASDPAATFTVSGMGLSASQLSGAGVDPVSLEAAGVNRGGAVTLERARIRNRQGFDVTASGRLLLQGNGLDIKARGSAPLSIGEAMLADRGTRLSGTAQFDIAAAGSLADPRLSGSLSLADGGVSDPLSNVRLEGLSAEASLSGDSIALRRAQARLVAGGSISASGTIGVSGSMPADLSVTVDRARYSDGETFSTTASGSLRLTGNIADGPLLAGTVTLSATEIAVPENFGGASAGLDVEHVAPPAEVKQTLKWIEATQPKKRDSGGGGSDLRLDVTVLAPNQIFVRGRGLDAELGGQVRVTGRASAVQPVGAFELRRGRLSILGQRLDLTEGAITLSGDLDPQLYLRAATRARDVEAYIILSGSPSDPQVTFASNPELPQDEVLSQIVFGRSISDLSAVQIARLAAGAAELAGGRNASVVDSLRRGIRVDDLDVVEDTQGNAAVRAGKYVSDNVYLGVQSSGQETETTIDLDLTDNIKARGSLSGTVETGIGIFIEKDF